MRCRVSALTCALRVAGILTEHDSEHGKIRLAKPAPNYMGTPTWGHPHGDVQAPAMAPALGQRLDVTGAGIGRHAGTEKLMAQQGVDAV